MEEIIKEYKERFGNIKKKFVRGSKEDFVGLINELSINILKAQNKELEERNNQLRMTILGVDINVGVIRGYEHIIEENNKIINNLSK